MGSFAAVAFYNRGTAYGQMGSDAAFGDFNEALRLDPKFAAAYTARGTANWFRGKPDLALADWSEAIRLAPNYPIPYLNALPYMNRGALYYGARHEFDKAIADLDEAVRIEPKNGLAFSNRGWVLGQQGQYERSIADLDNAIKLMPNLAKAYNNRGFALGQIGQLIGPLPISIARSVSMRRTLRRGGTGALVYDEKGQFRSRDVRPERGGST